MNRLLLLATAALLCAPALPAQAPAGDLAFNAAAAPAADSAPGSVLERAPALQPEGSPASAPPAPPEGAPAASSAPAVQPAETPVAGSVPASALDRVPALQPEGAAALPSPDESLNVLLQSAPPEIFSPEPLEETDLSAAPASDPLQSPGAESSADQDTAGAPVHPKVKLLPDNISWFEKAMWGESGVLRSIGIASPLTPQVRMSELGVRRTMLTMHQIGGFVTLGMMGAAVVYGQRYLDNFQRTDRSNHQTFVTLTIVSYGLTAALAALSPPPLIRRDETSTTTIHKTLAWVHFAGMIVTPILGSMINRRGTDFLTQARYHQVAAYITTAVFTAAMVVMTF